MCACLYLPVSRSWFHPFFEPFLLRSPCAPSFSIMTAVVSFVVFVFLVCFRPGAKFVCVAQKQIWVYVPPRSGLLWSCLYV